MRLSKLQKFILLKCFEKKNGTEKKEAFYSFYPKKEWSKSKNSIQIRVHNSIEALVDNDLLAAYGHRTAKKFYIDNVRLTYQGRLKAKELITNRQSRLPIK